MISVREVQSNEKKLINEIVSMAYHMEVQEKLQNKLILLLKVREIRLIIAKILKWKK